MDVRRGRGSTPGVGEGGAMTGTRGRVTAGGLGAVRVLALAALGPGAHGQVAEQPGDGGGMAGMPGAGNGSNLILVLMAPAVQTELKLSEGQKTRVFELAREA